ncbi:MAG: sulfotransferase [Phycisphaeraceae bacterium]
MSGSLPHRWSLDHNPLSGLTLGRWWTLLRDNGFAVDGAYAHRAAFITGMSAFNSLCHAIEFACCERSLRAVHVRQDPVFITGHWRSGTTHLHNLLGLDSRLTYPTTYQVVNPMSFLSTQRILPRLFAPLLPKRRPMDDMKMSFDAPQEDELALSLLSGMSLYLSLSFPRRASHYDRYLTFADASVDETARWKDAFRYFVRKLSLCDSRRFVFKSPGHTARIGLLLELFPEARFIHIHRDPYAVFQSSRHYFNTAAWHANLQAHDPTTFDDAILRRYDVLYDAYLAERELIPQGRLYELGYDALTANPLDELERAYSALDLGSFAPVAPRLRTYLASHADYRPNAHRPLDEPTRRRVARAWQRYFDEFGYRTGFESRVSTAPLKESAA